MTASKFLRTVLAIVLLAALAPLTASEAPSIGHETVEEAVATLVKAHGEANAGRIRLGVEQVAARWWPEDGDDRAFVEFCRDGFLVDENDLRQAFVRLQQVMEQVDGHLHEIRREITSPMQLDTGPVSRIDQLFGNVDLAAHVAEDLFGARVAQVALLNFPVHTLRRRLDDGPAWDRETWARSRMMDRFAQRVPAGVAQETTRAFTVADQYIADYNIRMDRLLAEGDDGTAPRLFDEGLRLITHWGLRDELKSRYADADGLRRQRMIHRVMQRIVRQEIPRDVIDNPDLLWTPGDNIVRKLDGSLAGDAGRVAREPDTRYAMLLDVFHAVRKADPYSPVTPNYIDRRFNLERQIPREEVESLLISVLGSPEFQRTAELIRGRLGRPLEAFDIWYDGFGARGAYGEDELDEAVSARYPDVAAFQGDLPRILRDLGFSEAKASWLASHIVVDPSRGAGHAMGAVRREDRAHLRTRIGAGGMDYKGYNIAVHELGHNVEQVFSLNGIDHWWLNGVPNTAFTEALAFVFQNRDMELLGMASRSPESRHLEALKTLWSTAEIGGVALVDIRVWRWMYEHPQATPAQLRVATLEAARDVWNQYFARAFGTRDEEILAIYSHMIAFGLYLPDYPLGHIIAFQVAAKLRAGDFGAEFERISRQGRLTPDAWMRGAVGKPVSADALLSEARTALRALRSAD